MGYESFGGRVRANARKHLFILCTQRQANEVFGCGDCHEVGNDEEGLDVMPKVFASELERKIYQFRKWFKGKRAMENVTQIALAREMGVSQQSVSNKITTSGTGSEITYKDLLIFFREVNATDEEILKYMKL